MSLGPFLSLALKRLGIAFLALVFSLVLGEAALFLHDWCAARGKGEDGKKKAVAMPEEWKARRVNVPGAKHAYVWHGKLHVHDELNMRHIGPYKPRNPNVFRIVVVGDSMTYGEGVAEEESYPKVLEKLLGRQYRVEVINLGVMGYQSEDVLRCLPWALFKLKPELVIYGVCLNDFLPSGIGEDGKPYRLPAPPTRWERSFGRLRLVQLAKRGFEALEFSLGMGARYRGQFLNEENVSRFGLDARNINRLVSDEHGLPPVLAMVLTVSPPKSGVSLATLVAERLLLQAGFKIIPASRYFDSHAGEDWSVSPWEGHPSAAAHRLFADILREELLSGGHLEERFRISAKGFAAGGKKEILASFEAWLKRQKKAPEIHFSADPPWQLKISGFWARLLLPSGDFRSSGMLDAVILFRRKDGWRVEGLYRLWVPSFPEEFPDSMLPEGLRTP